jgi:cyanophycinase-like exopeptidase
VATIVNNLIRIVGVGTAVITASQSGNTTFDPAPNVSQTLTVNKANQTITFPTLGTKVWGTADFSPGATASSGLNVTYTSSNTAVVTIVNNQIRLVGIGSSTITASQSGNANYNAAPNVSQSITISKANQTITFPVLSNKPYGSPDFLPGATSSSGLAITYSSSKTSVATIVNGMIRIVGVGSCNITARQSGNTYYNAATSVTRSLTVVKANQTITFPPIPNKVIGSADFSPGATATSGLTVTYSSSNTAVATIVSGKIRVIGAGTCNITASQSGNTNYNAAPSVIQPFTVTSSARNIFSASNENEPGTVFPNPFRDRFQFRFHIDQAESVKWELFSISGKKIREIKQAFFSSGDHIVDFYTGPWASGNYILRMSTGKRVESFRIMIIK